MPEGRVAEYAGSRGNYYEFEDGSTLEVLTTPVWCRRCGGITDGEEVESVEAIDRKIAELHDTTSTAYKIVARGVLHELSGGGDEFLRERIEELRLRRRWREHRQAPPKCIECGSSDLVQLPHGEAVAHPQGNGSILVRCAGMCSTSFNNWYFTPEGDRIPRDTKPSYWHHPALDNSPEELRRFLEGRLGNERG